MEYYENSGRASARLLWSSASQSKEVIPESALTPDVSTIGSGLSAEYFGDTSLTNLKLTRLDPRVDFSWGNSSPDPMVPSDSFSVRWTGNVQPRYSETYNFYTVSDDGVRLWVNGKLLIDNWTNHSPTEDAGTITLTAGQKYDIVMEYYDYRFGAVAQLFWSSPQQSKEIVPGAHSHQTCPPLASAEATRDKVSGNEIASRDLIGQGVCESSKVLDSDRITVFASHVTI